MSCKECERHQTECEEPTYIRIGDGNVAIVACAEHTMQLITIVREHHDMKTRIVSGGQS